MGHLCHWLCSIIVDGYFEFNVNILNVSILNSFNVRYALVSTINIFILYEIFAVLYVRLLMLLYFRALESSDCVHEVITLV